MASIFVQIPSYRDFELPKTLRNLAEQSSGRHHISIGVHRCLMFEDEVVLPELAYDHVGLNSVTSIAPDNIGEQRSRLLANELFDGEDYYLQIDSHSRVIKDWDDLLIRNMDFYRSVGFNKPLITSYPHDYHYGDDGKEIYVPTPTINRPYRPHIIMMNDDHKNFERHRIPNQRSVECNIMCCYTSSISGGFLFTTGDFANIKPNPKIAFWGSEILTAARAFTRGYDLLTPIQPTVWHLYNAGRKFKDVRRHVPWGDFPGPWKALDAPSRQETNRIFEHAIIGEYELGDVRTLQEYGEYAGIDFAAKVITQANYEIHCRA